MGSWANSIHVKHADHGAVGNAVREAFAGPLKARQTQLQVATVGAGGHDDDGLDSELNEDDFDAEDFNGEDSGPRKVRILKPINGWTGVLDSEAMVPDLAQELSRELATDALWVGVNDSDGWMFQLYRCGKLLDEFDSLGESEDDDAAFEAKMREAEASNDPKAVEKAVQEMFEKHAPKGPIVMPDGLSMLPHGLVHLGTKVDAGTATFWERIKYRWIGLSFLFRVVTGRFKPDDAAFGFDIPRGKELSPDEVNRLVANVRLIFPEGDEKQLRELLPQSRFPAEGLLGDFLAIIGLPRTYQHLSYEYIGEFSKRELKAEGIVEVAHIVGDA